jgi:hypothetical protein
MNTPGPSSAAATAALTPQVAVMIDVAGASQNRKVAVSGDMRSR